jgi:hypothetical protein
MEVIFKRSDFRLCDVPVPKGYPQSQTHAGIVLAKNKFYLTTSPFPLFIRNRYYIYFWALIKKITFGILGKSKLYRGEDYENPCFYIGIANENSLIPPTKFRLIKGCPLMQKPENKYGLGSYCSDPDIFFENDMFYILNRTSFRKSRTGVPAKDYETKVHIISLQIENDIILKKHISTLFYEQDASPCLTRYNNKYIYMSLCTNSYNDGQPCEALYLRKSDNIENGWSEKQKVNIKSKIFEPWHMSVFQHQGKLYSIISCIVKGIPNRCWTMLGEFSTDLSELVIYQKPLTDFVSYRSSAVILNNGQFVLYNTTVNEIINGGKSVDGREIIMTSCSFDKLLTDLKANERNN